ncbi:hypothetical protein E4T56_gene18235 [Termitomyces sp. T112]|nr:hypothetical protein E4T56_gene18235 [Termitomyces sp. T112]
MEDMVAEMTVSALAIASASNTAKHPPHVLVVAIEAEQRKGHGKEGSTNRGDNWVAGPSTPKDAVGSVTKGLAMVPRVATTPKSKGKEKGKAREEEEEEFKQKAMTVVDTGMGAGVVLEKAKEKSTVLLGKQQAFRQQQGVCDNCWAKNNSEDYCYPMGAQPCYCCDSTRKSCLHSGKSLRSTGRKFAKTIAVRASSVQQMQAFVEEQRKLAKRGEPIQVRHSSLLLLTSQDGSKVGGSRIAKGKQQEKSKEVVESKDDGSNRGGDNGSNSNNDIPLAQKQPSRLMLIAMTKQQKTVTSNNEEEETKNVEMRKKTLLMTIAKVEPVVSGQEVEGKGEVEAEAIEPLCSPRVLLNASPDFPNPHPPSTPTPGNSNTSLANPDYPLANSNTFSTVINTSPKFLEPFSTVHDPIICFQLPLPWFPNLP